MTVIPFPPILSHLMLSIFWEFFFIDLICTELFNCISNEIHPILDFLIHKYCVDKSTYNLNLLWRQKIHVIWLLDLFYLSYILQGVYDLYTWPLHPISQVPNADHFCQFEYDLTLRNYNNFGQRPILIDIAVIYKLWSFQFLQNLLVLVN